MIEQVQSFPGPAALQQMLPTQGVIARPLTAGHMAKGIPGGVVTTKLHKRTVLQGPGKVQSVLTGHESAKSKPKTLGREEVTAVRSRARLGENRLQVTGEKKAVSGKRREEVLFFRQEDFDSKRVAQNLTKRQATWIRLKDLTVPCLALCLPVTLISSLMTAFHRLPDRLLRTRFV